MMNKELDEAIRRSGLKNTKSRSAILGILERSDRPVSAEQVFLRLREAGAVSNLSTVYRTLEALAEKNLAAKLSLSGASRNLYEYNRMVHRHYLVCLGCSRVVAVEGCPLGDYEKRLAEKTEYQITGHKLDIYGYCPACRKKPRPEEEKAVAP